MKTLVVSNLYGDFDLVNTLYLEHPETDMCISLGDNYLFAESTPLKFFLRSKFRSNATKSIEYNKKGFVFSKPFFTIYGELDDPFIPQNELGFQNFFPIWQSTMDIMAHNEDMSKSRVVKLGFLSGYYSSQNFKLNNIKRMRMSREKKSLRLCSNDFNSFSKSKLDYLFMHDSPIGFPNEDCGSPQIWDLQKKVLPETTFYGHHRTFSWPIPEAGIYKQDIGVGEAEIGYYILDMFSNNLTRY